MTTDPSSTANPNSGPETIDPGDGHTYTIQPGQHSLTTDSGGVYHEGADGTWTADPNTVPQTIDPGDGHGYTVAPGQDSFKTAGGDTYVRGSDGGFSPLPSHLDGQGFLVALHDMEQAIGDLGAGSTAIRELLVMIGKCFAVLEEAWKSPSGMTAQEVATWFTKASGQLNNALDQMHDRLGSTYQNYLDAERTNYSSLFHGGSTTGGAV